MKLSSRLKAQVPCWFAGTCRLPRIDPQAYLTWVLPKLAAATNQTATGLLPHDYAREHPPDIPKANTR